MSATRLLVLGAVRIMQPVHGYDVRRELISWRLEQLANVKSGSIYGALRTLAKDGCIAVKTRESEHSRPERTVYVLTGEGEKEFQRLLHESWWTVSPGTEPLVPALGLMPFMSREELLRALPARLGRLTGELESTRFTRRAIRDGATGENGDVPEHVREVLDFVTAKLRAEITWTRQFQQRLRDGAYQFVGEPAGPDGTGDAAGIDEGP